MHDRFAPSIRHWAWAVAALVLGTLALALAVRIANFEAIPISRLLRDPNAIADQLWYNGLIESAGILTMAATTGILLFAASVVRSPSRMFLAGAGLLTGVMVLDDSYMLHEQRWFVGIPEHAAFAAYAITLAGLLFRERQRLGRTPILILGVSLGFLGLAAVADFKGGGWVNPFPKGTEDMAEFMAFQFWAAYFISTARLTVAAESAGS